MQLFCAAAWQMTVAKALAIAELWRSRCWDTADISLAIGVHEAEVVKVIDIMRDRERGVVLRIVE